MKRLLLFAVLVLLVSCEDLFQYSPDEVSPHTVNINDNNIQRINFENDTLRIIVFSDIHHAYDELIALVNTLNEKENSHFAIITGDLTNFGLQFEYDRSYDDLKKLKMPFIAAAGNHDVLANGQTVFEKMYGKLDFSFMIGAYKFIFLNTNSREFGFNGRVPNIDFLRAELADTNAYVQAVVVGHVPSFDSDFDPALEAEFRTLVHNGKVNTVLFGHKHSYMLEKYYHDEVNYLVSDDLFDRSYVELKLSGESVTFERKFF